MPLSTAVLTSLRRRRGGSPSAAPRGGGRPGVAFIPECPDARVSVEIAFGADLTANSATWSWTDVTADVRASGISTKLGRGDESGTANPAELTLTLGNTTGDYSTGGRSRWYPYVRRNTPVRCRIDPGTGPRAILYGFATGWEPGWDSLDGGIPVVRLSASGTLRRLAQGSAPIISPVRRYLENAASVVSYWPCEVGSSATSFPASIGAYDMTWTGTADLASSTDFTESRALPKMNGVSGVGGSFRASVGSYTAASDSSTGIRGLFSFPSAGTITTDSAVIMRVWFTGGTLGRFELIYRTGGGGDLGVIAYDSNGALLAGASNPIDFNVDGNDRLLSLEMYQSGGTCFYGLNSLQQGQAFYSSIGGTPSVTATIGTVSRIELDPSAVITGVGFGHIAVLNARSNTDPLVDTYPQLNGYPSEVIISATGRVYRLCTENAIELNHLRISEGAAQSADIGGSQPIDTALNLLQACATQERGVLWDGVTAGLSYTGRRIIENAAPLFTIDAAAGELAAPFDPVDDDQRTRNKVTVTRTGGAVCVAEDVTGVMGTSVVGTYDDSVTIGAQYDQAATDVANWLVHQGTTTGLRYPTVTIDLRATPRLAVSVVDLYVGARVDIVNLATALDTATAATVSLTVEGIAHKIGPREWTVTLTCSPFDPWKVALISDETGDTGEFVQRIDADTSTLNATYAAGVTSIDVATSGTGPLWTTTADDYPLYLDVGGERVRATACSGGSSPQTFTVDALGVVRLAGAAVAVWVPPVIGL